MLTYKEAGVDIQAGNSLVKRIQKRCPSIGGFNGLFPFGDHYLVACTDGVGTKLKLANALGRHDTVGIDLVAMCVNDLICCGAKPLYFLDYFASSKLNVDTADAVISGILKACEEAGCQLLGGETAEMPGFYQGDLYDICGFAQGIVHKDSLIDGSNIQKGDCLLGIASSGLHSNGFSLVNRIVKEPFEELLTPTRIYVKEVLDITDKLPVKGMAHITGGGLQDNISRIIPKGLSIHIDRESWKRPEIFSWIKETGNVDEEEMFSVFNMGIGFVLVVDASIACQFPYPVIGKVI